MQSNSKRFISQNRGTAVSRKGARINLNALKDIEITIHETTRSVQTLSRRVLTPSHPVLMPSHRVRAEKTEVFSPILPKNAETTTNSAGYWSNCVLLPVGS